MSALGWEILASICFIVCWVVIYGYALAHRHHPFWAGFLDPFGVHPRPRSEPLSDAEALRRDWQAVGDDMRKAAEDFQKQQAGDKT